MTVGATPRSCLEVSLPCEPASVPRARHLVRELLARKHLGDHPGVLLSVSEACANAIVHAYPSAGRATWIWRPGSTAPYSASRFATTASGLRHPDLRQGAGYGLLLIEAHVVDLDVRHCDPGTEVAMMFDLSAR